MGEEPAISGSKGICNIFFTNCNLQCVFCQNYQISQNLRDYRGCEMELEDVIHNILRILEHGINIVGFVSAGHVVPQVKAIIKTLRGVGRNPVFVYNSNGYDKLETLQSLEGMIDVYLPDFKYSDHKLAKLYSDAADYPEIALSAIKEMYRQTGSTMLTDDEGYAMRGLIIRHLVMPGQPENSIGVLKAIAEEVSPNLHISLMSQYHPNPFVQNHSELGDTVKPRDYHKVVEAMTELGFTKGYVQEMTSAWHYNPDFRKQHPFESM